MKDIGSAEAQEVAKEGNVASSRRSTVNGAVREGVESNGGVGLGDSVNVGGGGWGFKGTIGEQNSDGEWWVYWWRMSLPSSTMDTK